jgi:hypothetical protein
MSFPVFVSIGTQALAVCWFTFIFRLVGHKRTGSVVLGLVLGSAVSFLLHAMSPFLRDMSWDSLPIGSWSDALAYLVSLCPLYLVLPLPFAFGTALLFGPDDAPRHWIRSVAFGLGTPLIASALLLCGDRLY